MLRTILIKTTVICLNDINWLISATNTACFLWGSNWIFGLFRWTSGFKGLREEAKRRRHSGTCGWTAAFVWPVTVTSIGVARGQEITWRAARRPVVADICRYRLFQPLSCLTNFNETGSSKQTMKFLNLWLLTAFKCNFTVRIFKYTHPKMCNF
jgi:hypothetical protein